MAERVGLASMTDLAYIFPGVNISKGLAFCSLEQRYSFFLSALAYISRLSLSLSTSRKLPPTNCYSRHHLNNISSTLSCTALCCFYYNCPGLLLTLIWGRYCSPLYTRGNSGSVTLGNFANITHLAKRLLTSNCTCSNIPPCFLSSNRKRY